VAASVRGVAFTREIAVRFERVEQRHEDARVDVHQRAKLALDHRAATHPQGKLAIRIG
jgi:hypothetical protein